MHPHNAVKGILVLFVLCGVADFVWATCTGVPFYSAWFGWCSVFLALPGICSSFEVGKAGSDLGIFERVRVLSGIACFRLLTSSSSELVYYPAHETGFRYACGCRPGQRIGVRADECN